MKPAITLVLMINMLAPLLGNAEESPGSIGHETPSDRLNIDSALLEKADPQKLAFRTVKVDEPLLRECERICRMTSVITECIRRNCKATITIPDRAELIERAIHFANARYKNQFALMDVQTYLGTDETPVSYLVIVGTQNEVLAKKLSKSGVLSQILAGSNPARWDDKVVWLDMSTDSRYSPIRSSGIGVPAEWLAINRIKQIHNKTAQISKRYFSALSPALEFTDEKGERFFYQHITPGKLAGSMRFKESKVRRLPSKSKAQWFHFLNQAK